MELSKGTKFHKLTFTGKIKPVNNTYKLLCKCDCGNEKWIRKQHFNEHGTRSCGCIKKGRSPLAKGEAAFNTFFQAYKVSAKRRNIEFRLTKAQVKAISGQNCYYCGIEPTERFGRRFDNFNGNCIVNGIDRKDNSLGYTLNNSVSCCKVCNRAKNTLSEESFMDWISRLVKFNVHN